MVESCCAPYCKNKRNSSSRRSFFKFPLAYPNLTKTWVTAINREKWQPSKYSTICSDHFSSECLYHKRGNLYSLKTGAVPTIFNIPTLSPKRKYVRKKPYLQRSDYNNDPLIDRSVMKSEGNISYDRQPFYSEERDGSQSDSVKQRNLQSYSSQKLREVKVEAHYKDDICAFRREISNTDNCSSIDYYYDDDDDVDSVRGLDDSVYVKDEEAEEEKKLPPLIDGSDVIIFAEGMTADQIAELSNGVEIISEVHPVKNVDLVSVDSDSNCSEPVISDTAESILKESLKCSKRVILGMKAFRCIRCNVTYSTVMKLQVHVNVFHSEYSKSFFCFMTNCTAVFDSEDKLKRHISRKHKITKCRNFFKCNDCQFQSSSVDDMKRHIIDHIKHSGSCNSKENIDASSENEGTGDETNNEQGDNESEGNSDISGNDDSSESESDEEMSEGSET